VTAEPTMALAGQPVLEFQPAVDLATGRLLGMEALVRWEHPTKGRIAPDILIPWAEENGDIVSLNSWVMEAACSEAQLWSTGLQLAVNCSIIQLRRGEASKAARNALDVSGLNPDRLTIEVTERTINDDRAAADLRALSELGVHLAVDDVGTSWSSLQVLRKFAIEIVKIDRAFINNLEADEGMNRAIVEAIIHVGHSLAMSTVAEGVESSQQAAILREFGADVGQGYFFAPPLREDEAHELATAEPRPIFSLGPGRESSAAASRVQRTVAVHVATGQLGTANPPGAPTQLGGSNPNGSSPGAAAGSAAAGSAGAGSAGAGSEVAGSATAASTGTAAAASAAMFAGSDGAQTAQTDQTDSPNSGTKGSEPTSGHNGSVAGYEDGLGGTRSPNLDIPVTSFNGSASGARSVPEQDSGPGSGSNSILGSGSISGPGELGTDESHERQHSSETRETPGEVA
jgi:EAL domain-containing protein (putative c-di-GMP-specific phosphodiesterase class I)